MDRRDTTLAYLGRNACERMVFVTGNGRSGTTLVGKLIHSMRHVEYVFEPPTLIALLPLIPHLSDAQFRLLFECYCIEDLLMGQVTGRGFNMNRHDDSRIDLVKSREEVDQRLNSFWNKAKATIAAVDSTLAIKIPNMTFYIADLRRLYPDMAFVVTQRAPNPVLQSVLEKKWFANETLAETSIVWPSQTRDFATPSWVAPDDLDKWKSWSELDRAGYYYLRVGQGAAGVKDLITVNYEELVRDPRRVVTELADKLGLEFGDMTQGLIEDTKARSSVSDDWVSKLSKEIRIQVEEFVDSQTFG